MAGMPRVDRRRFLQLAFALAAGTGLPGGTQPRRWQRDPFALGVASGAPEPTSVVLWTRLLGPGYDGLGRAAIPVRWEVAHDAQFARVARRGDTLALPELAHSVHAEVQGLEPDRRYFYRFLSGEAVSPVGRTRTLPEPDARIERLRLAYASCQRWEHGYYSAYRHMLQEDIDLVLFLGDYIYEYPNATAVVRSFPTLGWVRTLEEYRDRHALHRSDPDLQAMHAACPWLLTWDDHEVQNDYAANQPGDGFPLGLNAVSDFPERRAAAYQAYYEHMPLRAADVARALGGTAEATDLRLYSSRRFGRLADLLLLDTRQYRDIQLCGRPNRPAGLADPAACRGWNDPGRTLLGWEQEQWLDVALARAGARWTVLGQQSAFGARDTLRGVGERFWNDSWDGYAPARRRLTDALQRHRIANPVMLGGDVHENWVGHVKADYQRPGSAVLGVEFCGTSITSRSKDPASVAARLAENPHFVFADGRRRGYGVVDLTPARLTTHLRVLDDATRPDARIDTSARFTVEAGTRQLEQD